MPCVPLCSSPTTTSQCGCGLKRFLAVAAEVAMADVELTDIAGGRSCGRCRARFDALLMDMNHNRDQPTGGNGRLFDPQCIRFN